MVFFFHFNIFDRFKICFELVRVIYVIRYHIIVPLSNKYLDPCSHNILFFVTNHVQQLVIEKKIRKIQNTKYEIVVGTRSLYANYHIISKAFFKHNYRINMQEKEK